MMGLIMGVIMGVIMGLLQVSIRPSPKRRVVACGNDADNQKQSMFKFLPDDPKGFAHLICYAWRSIL